MTEGGKVGPGSKFANRRRWPIPLALTSPFLLVDHGNANLVSIDACTLGNDETYPGFALPIGAFTGTEDETVLFLSCSPPSAHGPAIEVPGKRYERTSSRFVFASASAVFEPNSDQAERLASELIELSTRYNFAFWLAGARMVLIAGCAAFRARYLKAFHGLSRELKIIGQPVQVLVQTLEKVGAGR